MVLGWVPGLILKFKSPSMVGTATIAPKIACV